MATPIAFNVVSKATGLPVTGALGGFTVQAWDAFSGASRPAPAVVEVGGGIYQVLPTPLEEAAGVAVLITTGEEPSHWLLAVHEADRSNQFIPLLFLDAATGALWAGAGPTQVLWTGDPATAPVGLAAGVWVIRPSALDLDEDAVGLLAAAPGAAPTEYLVGVRHVLGAPPPPDPLPPPGLPLPPPADDDILGDIRLALDEWLRGDAVLAQGDLETDAGLETAIYLSLFLDRYDDTDDDPTQRRGWWADGITGTLDRIGSRLWLAETAGKLTPDLPDKLRTWTREALGWLVEDGVARDLEVTAALTARGYTLEILVYRPSQHDPSRFRFARTWAAQETR